MYKPYSAFFFFSLKNIINLSLLASKSSFLPFLSLSLSHLTNGLLGQQQSQSLHMITLECQTWDEKKHPEVYKSFNGSQHKEGLRRVYSVTRPASVYRREEECIRMVPSTVLVHWEIAVLDKGSPSFAVHSCRCLDSQRALSGNWFPSWSSCAR